MKFFKRLAPLAALASLLAPSMALADVDVRSCCVLTSGTTVSSCFQFTDAVQGDAPAADVLNTVRQHQEYKCQNVPYLYQSEQGKTATWFKNDGQNSGVCGNGSSTACTASRATLSTVHAKCQTDTDCGTASAYVCETGLCKIREGQGCIGSDGSAVNCASGLVCRTTPSGSKCLAANADLVETGGTTGISVGSDNAAFVPVVPNLSVPIPGFQFTPASESDGEVYVPYLAEYVNAIYRYMTAIVLTVAIVMIVYGGFRYLLASTPLAVKDGKTIITDAVIGMILVLGAYVILNTVNPNLLTLKTLRLERVISQEVELSLAFGGMADDGAEAPVSNAPLTEAEAAAPGTWRANALAVCGDSNVAGMSLDARKARLKNIVMTWTNLAATQKGSIYVRGGTLSCGATPTEYAYKARTLKGIQSSGYNVNVTAECLNNPPANNVSSGDACATSLSNEYRRLVATPGNANGLICGDCGSYQRSLMRCFGGNSYSQPLMSAMFGTSRACENYTPGSDDVGFMRITNLRASRGAAAYDDNEIANFVNRLQFGDMLMWSSNDRVRHVFMYTGKAGLPYEIVEMGGGGQGDVIGGSDGKQFWSKVGLPNFDGSHVKAHRSAIDYIKSSPRSGAKCMKAVRVIDN